MRHFRIALALLRFYVRTIPGDWYRRPPFLPVASGDYLAWRMRTAYGDRPQPRSHLIKDVWQFGDWLRSIDLERSKH